MVTAVTRAFRTRDGEGRRVTCGVATTAAAVEDNVAAWGLPALATAHPEGREAEAKQGERSGFGHRGTSLLDAIEREGV